MKSSAIVTGGTGGLGAAVVKRLLEDGWRVVVPWVVESELDRVERRDGLELVQADLFELDSVQSVVALGAADADALLRGVVNLVGGFAVGGRVHETPVEEFERQFRLNLRATYLAVSTGAAPPAGGGRWVDRVRRHACRRAAVLGRCRLYLIEGRRDRVRPGGRRGIQA